MKRGFTLIELIAVIAILGLVLTITVPIITSSINESKNRIYDRQRDLIIDAARSYMSKYPTQLPIDSTMVSISVSKLKSEGFISNQDINNPLYVSGTTDDRTKSQKFNGVVCVSYSSNNYNYTYKESNTC